MLLNSELWERNGNNFRKNVLNFRKNCNNFGRYKDKWVRNLPEKPPKMPQNQPVF